MKAKNISLWAIVIAMVWVGLLFLAKAFVPVFFTGKTLGLSMTEIIASGAFFVVACSPVYRSIWLDKKFGISTESVSDGEASSSDDKTATDGNGVMTDGLEALDISGSGFDASEEIISDNLEASDKETTGDDSDKKVDISKIIQTAINSIRKLQQVLK